MRDVLVELSARCVRAPDFWPAQLLPIVQRLRAVRSALGGSLLLLRGFNTLLESGDPRLAELQCAVLALVDEIHRPATLAAYLAVMANGERPPMELLLARLFTLGAVSHRVQPQAEIRFPQRCSGK